MTQKDIKRILLFDDDADFRKLLKVRLGRRFEDVELEEYDPVARGIPGKEFDWSRYDVLLLDYNLQAYGITGLDILHTNRRNPDFPATIMLTGQGSEEVAVRALKAGVYDYLRKETLDKDQLGGAIIEAYEKQQAERERMGDLTRHSHAFNKALFYRKLEQQQGDTDDGERVLLLINLDEHQLIEELAGLIMRDNIIRHIARQCYQVFEERGSHPNITRFSDIAVALLVDDPGAGAELEGRIRELCEHLQKSPYEFEDKVFHFTVSIGVVRLSEYRGSAEAIIRAARRSCTLAERQEGNSYYIFDEPLDQHERAAPEPVTAGPKERPPSPPPPEATGENPGVREAAPSTTAKPPPPPDEPEPAAGSKGDAENRQPDTKSEAPPAAATAPESRPETAPAEPEPVVRAQEFMQAFRENRLTQTFQPVISLVDGDGEGDDYTIYYASLQMLNPDGSVLGAGALLRSQDAELRKSIDRWMLRETIGHVVNSSSDYLFILPLSRASMADANLFNWLRKLLSGLEEQRPGRFLGLEIDAADFMAVQKPATALISYLRKTHGFKFALGNIGADDDIADLCTRGQFDMIRLNHDRLQDLAHGHGDESAAPAASVLRTQGIRIIADHIEDAMALTAAIGSGADYAMGAFVGEPADQIEDQANVESLEII